MFVSLLRTVLLDQTKINNDESQKLLKSSNFPDSYTFYQFGPVDTKFELVTNTWPWLEANNAAWNTLISTKSSVDAIVSGCSKAEEMQYDHTVGWGGSPDSIGESTLDAMIMHGPTHNVGSVANLHRIKDAIKVAKNVLHYTKHTLLVGESATQFALQMGFQETNLTSDYSLKKYQTWLDNNCQPNFYANCFDSDKKCPPYARKSNINDVMVQQSDRPLDPSKDAIAHDTIGMIVVESDGSMTVGTSTNGATHKIAGRVGDGPIVGSGGYVEQGIGSAVATGDGDVMMRFLPTKEAVMYLQLGYNPTQACLMPLQKIAKFYPDFQGAMVCVSQNGQVGAASYGWTDKHFQFVLRDRDVDEPIICTTNIIAQ